MTYEEFIDTIKANPTLTTHGFGVDNGGDFNKERAELNNCFDEAQKCESWLSLVKRTKHPNRRIGSTYRLKHLVECWIDTYIHEGAFIAAALFLEFEIQPIKGKTSVYLNISSHSIE